MVSLCPFITSVFLLPLGLKAHPASTNDEPKLDAISLLDEAITAIGGLSALESITGITYSAPHIYRSQTLTQSYNLQHSDQSIASSGSQNISFSFSSSRTSPSNFQQRIDRFYHYSEYWIWAFPDLQPAINYTLLVQDGDDPWACFTHGQNSFFTKDPGVAAGYADPYLTQYLIVTARKFAVPYLLLEFRKANASLRALTVVDAVSGISSLAIYNAKLDITLILDPATFLPRMIRTYECHAIFGNSTSDILLTQYSPVLAQNNSTVQLPHRFQTLYNSAEVLEDFLVESVTINPDFPPNFFTVPANFSSSNQKSGPQISDEYSIAEIHEFHETGLWSSTFAFNISDVNITTPIPSIPQIRTAWIGYADYVQLIIEFESFVIVTDAPPHRSKILLQWIDLNIGKPVKYIVPSHHHHDHAYGVGDYVAAGATVVVPEVTGTFYSRVNGGNVSIQTYNTSHPFIVHDSTVQFRSFWHDEAPHARDWSYALAASSCPAEEEQVVVFNADVWSPGQQDGDGNGLRWDTGFARQWLDQAVSDGMPSNAVVVGAHGDKGELGTVDELESLLSITGFEYPDIRASDLCLSRQSSAVRRR